MTPTIFERVSNWNAERYARVYNHDLFKSMLIEEYEEYSEAKTLAAKLDGLADLFFITVGAMWKAKLSPYSYLYKNYKDILDYSNTSAIYDKEYLKRTVNRILGLSENEQQRMEVFFPYLLQAIFFEFQDLGCKKEEMILAIDIVCDSNDTKEKVKLIDSDKGQLKGKAFMNPIKRLKLLAESIQSGD